MNLIGVKKQ